MKNIRIYDGKQFCGDRGCNCGCPVIEYNQDKNMVEIYDPAKPENGKTMMTIEEYNALISNAKPMEVKTETEVAVEAV